MSGDIANPRIWEGADVYVAPLLTAAPTDVTTPWAAPWEALGLLSDDGAEETLESDSTDHFAWGGLLVRTTRNKFKRSMKVVALEDNNVVFGVVNPGSEAETDETGLTTRTFNVPTSNPLMFGLETRDGDITRRRIIQRGEVATDGTRSISSSDMTQFELTIAVYPDGNGKYYHDLSDDPQAEVVGS
jgi:hypothetical protein